MTAIAGGEVSGLNVTLQVEPATEEVDLSGIVGVSSGSSWQLYKDITGQMLIPTKYASDLRNGDNTYYIVVNSDDGKINRTYTLNIYKNYYVTVKYVSENNVFHSEEVLAGTTLETGPTIERDGYVFNGWGVEGYIVTEPVTFRANWTPKQYTITLNADGGNVSNNQQVITMHDEFRLPTASGKRGYSFDGWYTADGYKVAESNGAGSSVWNYASDMTLYAGWKKSQYSVSLNKNIVAAGTVYGASTGIDYNDSTTITAETNVGYTWLGWYEGGNKVTSSMSYTFNVPSRNSSYTAKWYKLDVTKNISVAGNISELTGTYKVGDSVTVTAETNVGYAWLGWYEGDTKVSSGADLAYTFQMPVAKKTYEARWKAKEYTVTLNPNSGTGVPASMNVTYGANYEIPTPTYEGYGLEGWFLDADKIDNTGIWNIDSNVELVAKWKITDYTITYNLNGGTVSSENANQTSYTIESLDITLNNPTRTGYNFIGWSGTELTGSTNMSVTITNGSTGDRSYTANWSTIEYTIGYTLNDGEVAIANLTKYTVETETFSLNNPTKNGYTFRGWSGTDLIGSNNTMVTITKGSYGERTYTANWTPTPYNINYTLNGGIISYENANPTSYTIESLDITLNNPTKTGYNFVGWSGTELAGSTNMSVTIVNGSTGDRSYTANWEAITTSVTFDINGGNSLSPDTTTISYDSTINFPIPTHSDPTQAFTGWYTDMAAGERITDNLGKGLNVWNKNGFEIQAWAVEDTTIILYARWGDASVPQYQRIDADGNLDATGTHILFGEWPQTIKTSDVTITETIDSRGYYLGNDGEYYARVVANPRTTNYKFSNNANVEIGTVYYFKVKPIKWRILNITNGKALILCESIVANMRYNYYYSGSQNGIYSHNYVESEIRAWLNQEFYNKAFSNLQKEIIQITEVDNSTYSTGYTGSSGAQYECGNTNDMIFLPSYREIINAGYGFNSNFDNNDGSRIRKVSDYSIATGVSMNTSTDYYRNAAYWWLRSPYYSWANSCYVRCIDYRGKGLNCENINNSNRVDNTSVGVVPALVIDLT